MHIIWPTEQNGYKWFCNVGQAISCNENINFVYYICANIWSIPMDNWRISSYPHDIIHTTEKAKGLEYYIAMYIYTLGPDAAGTELKFCKHAKYYGFMHRLDVQEIIAIQGRGTVLPKCNIALACEWAFACTRIIANLKGVAP